MQLRGLLPREEWCLLTETTSRWIRSRVFAIREILTITVLAGFALVRVFNSGVGTDVRRDFGDTSRVRLVLMPTSRDEHAFAFWSSCNPSCVRCIDLCSIMGIALVPARRCPEALSVRLHRKPARWVCDADIVGFLPVFGGKPLILVVHLDWMLPTMPRIVSMKVTPKWMIFNVWNVNPHGASQRDVILPLSGTAGRLLAASCPPRLSAGRPQGFVPLHHGRCRSCSRRANVTPCL